jgi:hypothetical protein
MLKNALARRGVAKRVQIPRTFFIVVVDLVTEFQEMAVTCTVNASRNKHDVCRDLPQVA